MFVYISCWANLGGQPGIAIFNYDEETAELQFIDRVREDLSCGVTYVDKQRKVIYFCIEEVNNPKFRVGGGGRVVAMKVDEKTGALEQIGEIDTFCPNPSYINQEPSGKFLVVPNHSAYAAATKIVKKESGEYACEIVSDDSVVELISLNEDGTFSAINDVVYHTGSSSVVFNSHPHCAVFSPSGNFFVVCDKGNDKIYRYAIDVDNKKIVQCGEPYQDVDGSKPRYCCFHPTLPFLYVNHEGRKTISVFRYDENGHIEFIRETDIVFDGTQINPGKGCSGILMHPSGKYMYCLIPSLAAICGFSIDEKTGIPKLQQFYKRDEPKLRAFAFSPDAKHLITTCIPTGDIEMYSIDENGWVDTTGQILSQKGAAYVTFYDVGERQ